VTSRDRPARPDQDVNGGSPCGNHGSSSASERPIALLLVATPIVLAPGDPAPSPAAAAIDNAEQARTIEALRQRKRERPVIAILALNEATEVTDLLVPYGVLRRARAGEIARGLGL
jgi:hypothetical protein